MPATAPDASDPSTRESDPKTGRAWPKRAAADLLASVRYCPAARSYLCFGACAWLVPFGAPLGSLLLAPRLQSVLRVAFYALALAQFAGFALLRVRGDRGAWGLLFASTAAVLGMLLVHRTAHRRRKYAVACR